MFQETAQIKESKVIDNAEMTDAMSDEDFKTFLKLARFVMIVFYTIKSGSPCPIFVHILSPFHACYLTIEIQKDSR